MRNGAIGLVCLVAFGAVAPLQVNAEPEALSLGGGEGRLLLDRDGDPLPPGALLRLGSTRLRHGRRIDCVAYSPDGKLLASGGDDGRVRVWDPHTGKLLYALPRLQSEVVALTFSHDGEKIAFIGDSRLHLTDLNGKPLLKPWPTGLTWAGASVIMAPDGKTVYAQFTERGSWPERLRAWDVRTGKPKFDVPFGKSGHQGPTALSSDGKVLAMARHSDSKDTDIQLRDAATGKQVGTLRGHTKSVLALALAPDNNTLASAGFDHTVKLWDLATGQEKKSVELQYVYSLAFSPDGKWLAADRTTNLETWVYDAGLQEKGRCLRRHDADYRPNQGLAFSPDSSTLAVPGHFLHVWDVATWQERFQHAGHTGWTSDLAFSPRGDRLAVVNGLTTTRSVSDESVWVWDALRGEKLQELKQKNPRFIGRVAFADKGDTLMTGWGSWQHGDIMLQRWDMASWRLLPVFAAGAKADKVDGFKALTGDGRLAVGRVKEKSEYRVWESATGRILKRFPVADVDAKVAFSADGRRLAWTSETDLRIWDVDSAKEIRRARKFRVDHLAFAPDGRTLALVMGSRAWHDRHSIVLETTDTGMELHNISCQRHHVNRLVFSPDGRTLATAGTDETVRLYEAGTGTLRANFEGQVGEIFALSFTRDGKRLASSGGDSVPLIWDVTGTSLPARATYAPLDDAQLTTLWSRLAERDGAQAWQAMHMLMRSAKTAVPFLEAQLLAQAPDVVDDLIRDLDSDDFKKREAASRQLLDLGADAEFALRLAVQSNPSLEASRRMRTLLVKLEGKGSHLRQRQSRAVEVLEYVTTSAARAALQRLAQTAKDNRIRQEARASLTRLEKS